MIHHVTPVKNIVYNPSVPQPFKNQLQPLDLGTDSSSERLKRIRKAKGKTQEELATLVGVTREAIAAYESGRIKLSEDMIIRISLALGVTSDDLLGLSAVSPSDATSLRITRRLLKIEQLPPAKQKTVLQALDLALKAVGVEESPKASE